MFLWFALACFSTVFTSLLVTPSQGFFLHIGLVVGLSFLTSVSLFAISTDASNYKYNRTAMVRFALTMAISIIAALRFLSFSSPYWLTVISSRGFTTCRLQSLGSHEVVPFLIGKICGACIPRTFYVTKDMPTSRLEYHLIGVLQKKGMKRIHQPWFAEVAFTSVPVGYERRDLSYPLERRSCKMRSSHGGVGLLWFDMC